MADDITIGELARAVSSAASRIENIAGRLESGQYVSTQVFDLTVESLKNAADALSQKVERVEQTSVSKDVHQSLDNRVKLIEDFNRWAFRIVGAVIITAVLALVIKAGGVGG